MNTLSRTLAASLALGGLALSTVGCTQLGVKSPIVTTADGKSVFSAAAAGADLVQAGQIVALAHDVYVTQAKNGGNAQVVKDLVEAQTVLVAAGTALEHSNATSGDLQQNLGLASAAIQSAIAGLGVVNPRDQAKVQGYLDAFRTAVAMYNEHAASAGLPTVPVSF